jgi:ABC-type antimicrobial peptide transport system permease subunit
LLSGYLGVISVMGPSSLNVALRGTVHYVPPRPAEYTVAVAVLAEASLSFLGLETRPPEPSWGSMLVALNFLSDALREPLDPRRMR